MHHIVTDVVWPVSMCGGHTGDPYKNGLTDSDAIWGVLTQVGSKNHVLDYPATGRGFPHTGWQEFLHSTILHWPLMFHGTVIVHHSNLPAANAVAMLSSKNSNASPLVS